MKNHTLKITALLAISFAFIGYLLASNPPIEREKYKYKTGSVLSVQINGKEITADDFRETNPDDTYLWTEGLAEENTRPANVGPGLENK